MCAYLFTGSNWFHADELEYDGTATMVPKREFIKIVKVHQIEKDAILVCYGNQLQIVNMQGHPKQPKKMISTLTFDFNIESIGECFYFVEKLFLRTPLHY